MLTFIIPVIAKEVSGNWGLVMKNLGNTLASIQNQTNPEWRAIIVSQSEPDLEIREKSKIIFIKAPHPPAYKPPKGEELDAMKTAIVRRANDIDRVRKLRVGASALNKYRTDFVMLLEADDLVSNRLCAFVEANKESNGWYFTEGYVWDGSKDQILVTNRFWTRCGSSWVVKVFYDTLPEEVSLEVDSTKLNLTLSGCPFVDHGHRTMAQGMEKIGKPISALPFPGAVYVKGHGGNLSIAYKPDSRFEAMGKIQHWKKNLINDFQQRKYRRPITDTLRKEFSLPQKSQ